MSTNQQQHELQIRDAGHYYEFEFKSKAFSKLSEFMDRLKMDNKEVPRSRKDENFTFYHPKIQSFTISYSQENNVVIAWKQKQKDLNPYKFAYHLWSKMSAQLKLYNLTDCKTINMTSSHVTNENVSEIKVCPYSLDFKYTFPELKKSFYFRLSYLTYCNHIEDEANYNPIGFSEDPNTDILINQNYLINVNLNNAFWEKCQDLLERISREFAVSYVGYKLSRGNLSQSNQQYQIFLDLFIKFLNVVPYTSSMNIFASREIQMGMASKGKQQLQSEVLAQIQIGFPAEKSPLRKNQVHLNQSCIWREMHPIKYSSISMAKKMTWSSFAIFKSFFSNVMNVSIVEPRKYGVFTYMSEIEIENFLLSCFSYVYSTMIVQLLFIAVPMQCVRDFNDVNLTFKIKLDPDLLSTNLENFKIIVETQALYEPVTISLQHYFFDQAKQTELSIFYIKINSKNDTKIFENELMFYLPEIVNGKQTKYIINLLVFSQIFGLLRTNVKENFQDIYRQVSHLLDSEKDKQQIFALQLNSEKQEFFFDYSTLSFEKDVTTNQLMINRLEFKQIHSFSNREKFTTHRVGIGIIKSDKFTVSKQEIDLSVRLDSVKIKETVEQIIQFIHNTDLQKQ